MRDGRKERERGGGDWGRDKSVLLCVRDCD